MSGKFISLLNFINELPMKTHVPNLLLNNFLLNVIVLDSQLKFKN